LQACRREGLIGVWVEDRKIAALGARVARGVTFHGFALNVAPNLEHFALIVPCGLVGVQVTSLEQELGQPIPMRMVTERVLAHFGQVFDVIMEATAVELLPS
jgi:lipoate-protein ligase B